ncbi:MULTISPECIES: hypothetical protein [Streptococcus]|jgi:hypothetical protein|uniref:hypothetical protein n=1 Tax=Streptococcus TaxID=1301 RepID=UPI000A6964E0|nr:MULTISPECIES: hypothetical protein [Streptococcus]
MPQLQPDTQLSAYTSKIRRPSPSSHLRVSVVEQESKRNAASQLFPPEKQIQTLALYYEKPTRKPDHHSLDDHHLNNVHSLY